MNRVPHRISSASFQRLILDTSTLVSAALRLDSAPHQALIKALGSCELCASAETLAELETVLTRKKFDRDLDQESRRSFVMLIQRHSHLFAVPKAVLAAVNPPCRDSGDNKFLALAQVAEVDVIVSSDADLLVLHPWNKITIVTAAEFVGS